jgi:hypothetical protein
MNFLNDIFSYAWRGGGKYVWITCVVLSVISNGVSFVPMIGVIAWLLLSGYFSAIYFQLIQSSAVGGKEAPEFPDTSNLFEDLIWPMVQIFVVAMVSFIPFFGYMGWAGEEYGNVGVGYGLLAFGILYFPMAMLAVVVLGRTGALSPHIVLPAIFRAGWLYWLGVLLLALLYLAGSLIEDILAGQRIVGSLVMSAVGAYTLMTNARILGVVYRERQEELGWL